MTTVVGGVSICNRIETLLKSIFVFHKGIIHFHFIADSQSVQYNRKNNGKYVSDLAKFCPLSFKRGPFLIVSYNLNHIIVNDNIQFDGVSTTSKQLKKLFNGFVSLYRLVTR